jgi:four helix bundle protein
VSRIKSFRDLEVWSVAIDLAVEAYRLTTAFPRSEQFGLTSQVRRSATSISSNLAEGHNRRSRRAYANHVAIALGSQAELDCLVELSVRLKFLADSDVETIRALVERAGKMLHGLARALEQRVPNPDAGS